ncbi:MAG: hypothetical protein KAS12_01745 [Candidatus Aenigmarchaeota archaeon]|nr:hypothetical protein [Candidatus Aenigmarchaeota archaeon]
MTKVERRFKKSNVDKLFHVSKITYNRDFVEELDGNCTELLTFVRNVDSQKHILVQFKLMNKDSIFIPLGLEVIGSYISCPVMKPKINLRSTILACGKMLTFNNENKNDEEPFILQLVIDEIKKSS